MAITTGTVLGPYEIRACIGAGGMGEVWRARDRRIGRDVAVKVLPESFAASDERVRRFELEARVAGTLNHPGLVTVLDVGTHDGAPYIVMELLEGKTLRETLGKEKPAALPWKKAIDYATQIAAALAVAHEKGIIHRDLKPENVIVTPDNRVKILDFGLAKLTEPLEGDARPPDARHRTGSGLIVGTPGFMSPEQVTATPVDHRTDIFALGSLLYEMLSGRAAFLRDSEVETMSAVLREEPEDLVSIDEKIPPAAAEIVRHCLEKNPLDRFQSARDLSFQLRLLSTSGLSAPRVNGTARKRRWLPAATVVALVLLGSAGATTLLRGRTRDAPQRKAFRQLTFASGVELFPTFSADGKTFAYVSADLGNRDIYVQRIDARGAFNITKDSTADDSEPAFSRDGAQIAFHSARDGGGIFVMGVTGESVRRVTDFGHNPSWSPDGRRIVVATELMELAPRSRNGSSELWIVDARTSVKRALIRGSDAVQPSWSPSGKRIAFWRVEKARSDLWTIEPDAPRPAETLVRVTADSATDWNPVWSADGKHLYFGSDRDGTLNLWRVAIDETSGRTRGAPEPVTLPGTANGHFALSPQGQIAYVSTVASDRIIAFPFDAKTGVTTAQPRTLLEGSYELVGFDIAPHDGSIAFATAGPQEDVFVARADGTQPRQLTTNTGTARGLKWSPDGKTLYFYSNEQGNAQIWSIRADGSNLTRVTDPAELQRHGLRSVVQPDVSPDGRTLAVQSNRVGVLVHLDRPPGQRIEKVPVTSETRVPVVSRWSPDGKRIVGGVNDPHTGGVPGLALYTVGSRTFEMLSPRGRFPRWLPDGRRILFVDGAGLGILDLDTRKTTAVPLPALPGLRLFSMRPSPDGSLLYMRQVQKQGDIWLMDASME